MPKKTRLCCLQFGRRRKHGSAIAEFGPALFVFLFFALFPCIDLMAVAIGTASISLAARQGASAAASSSDYGTALTAMQREVNAVKNSGFGAFLNLQPVGGYKSCGADLWIEQSDIASKKVKFCGPNIKAPTPVDSTNFIYEYVCVTTFQVGPWCNLSAVPFIGSVPGLGPPASIRYMATVAVEYPDGLGSSTTGGIGSFASSPTP